MVDIWQDPFWMVAILFMQISRLKLWVWNVNISEQVGTIKVWFPLMVLTSKISGLGQRTTINRILLVNISNIITYRICFSFFLNLFLFSSNETVQVTSTHNIHTYKYSITYALHNEYIKLARLNLHVKGYISNYIKSPHLPRYISIWLFMTQIPFSVSIKICSCNLWAAMSGNVLLHLHWYKYFFAKR